MPLMDFNSLTLEDCGVSLISDDELVRLMSAALAEDGVEAGDISTLSIVPDGRSVTADFVARESGVLAGLSLLQRAAALEPLNGRMHIDMVMVDGQLMSAGDVIGRVSGAWRDVLTYERTLLNLLSRLCGVASRTARFVAAVQNVSSAVKVCDSRKTTPGLRRFEKYAVRCGGGHLHRIGLDDAVMYKDNHLASIPEDQLAVKLAESIAMARSQRELRFVCIEVDRLEQLDVVLGLEAGLVDIVLLDNMGCDALVEAVAKRDASGRPIMLEASGGVTFDTVADIARTGIDRIAVGSITHGVKWLDIGLDITPA
ncbi:MAG: carboxylating nicotinate-nucleotide diphosphorylase [Phycisphaerales bacterium]|nr:carboxylating nicotinate-nucleotide diphosphorylase [Phycisphaerales bacterium]